MWMMTKMICTLSLKYLKNIPTIYRSKSVGLNTINFSGNESQKFLREFSGLYYWHLHLRAIAIKWYKEQISYYNVMIARYSIRVFPIQF